MHNRASLGLALAIMALTAYGIFSALAWPLKAKLFPLVISIPLFLLAAAEAAWVIFGKDAPAESVEAEGIPRNIAMRRTWIAVAWALGFFVLIMLVGFLIAVPAMVFLYLRVQSNEGWLFSIVFTAAVWGLFYGLFDLLLHLPFPAGWLLSSLGLG
ncbi:MAG TPA: tripartite tricarboxylate transporter TctB family protein [Burkholderiales bacterium]